MNNVSIGMGKNLRRIRLIKNLSLKEAGKLLNMSATAVSKYEKGEILLNSRKIIEFANAYKVNAMEILKIYNMPKIHFTNFRKSARLKGQNLELLKEIIENKIYNYIEIINLNEINSKKQKLKNYQCDSLKQAENIAIEFRKFLGVSNKQPISDLINTLENLGIVIIQIDDDEKFNGFDGLSEIINNIPIIVISKNIEDGARQRFTISHELGHLILTINNEENKEKLCNRFASALLMPEEAMINEFGNSRSNINLFELKAFKSEYKVSYRAILHRLKDLNIINEYLYKKLNTSLSKRLNKNDVELIEPEKTYNYKKTVYKLEADKVISLSKACELLGYTINEYNKQDYNY